MGIRKTWEFSGRSTYVVTDQDEELNNKFLIGMVFPGYPDYRYLKAKVFGGIVSGGGRAGFVDPAKLNLPDGRVRICTMRMGHIKMFIDNDDSYTSVAFEGLQLSLSDFSESPVRMYFDLKAVVLPNGRIHVYTTGLIESGEGNTLEAIISAR